MIVGIEVLPHRLHLFQPFLMQILQELLINQIDSVVHRFHVFRLLHVLKRTFQVVQHGQHGVYGLLSPVLYQFALLLHRAFAEVVELRRQAQVFVLLFLDSLLSLCKVFLQLFFRSQFLFLRLHASFLCSAFLSFRFLSFQFLFFHFILIHTVVFYLRTPAFSPLPFQKRRRHVPEETGEHFRQNGQTFISIVALNVYFSLYKFRAQTAESLKAAQK